MSYMVEFTSNGIVGLVTDVHGSNHYDVVWELFEDLCDVEDSGGTAEDFDEVLASHGCNERGAGIMFDIEGQGFEIETASDGSRFVIINGVEHDIVNIDYVPEIYLEAE